MFDLEVEERYLHKIVTDENKKFVKSIIERWIHKKGLRNVINDVERDINCDTLDLLTHLIEVGSLKILMNSNLMDIADIEKSIFHTHIFINVTIGTFLNSLSASICTGRTIFDTESLQVLMGRTYRMFLENEINSEFVDVSIRIFLLEPSSVS